MLGNIAVTWAFTGVSFLLICAISRMMDVLLALEMTKMSAMHWVVMLLWIGFMGYFEGYRGFQKGFSPRVAARVLYLKNNYTLQRLLLAPFFCLGYFGAPLRRRIFVVCLTLLIFALVILVQKMGEPWRQIIDAGVVVGLSWGLIAFWCFCYLSLKNNKSYVDPETS